MTDTEKNEILAAVHAALTGDRSADLAYLEQEAAKYDGNPETQEIADAILQTALGMIPQEDQDYLRKMLYIGDRPLDQYYKEAETVMRSGQTAKAIALFKPLYEHILSHFTETETERFFSFRNLLESNLYNLLYHPTKTMLKTPFDFSLFIGGYAYALVEVRRLEEAIPVLKEAIRYNPVNPDTRFELAEVYKLTHEPEKLLETICDTLPIASSSYAMARCYANLGYWATDIKDYKSAAAFYYESLMFGDDPRVAGEIKHLEFISREPIVPPTREMINAAFAKYKIYHGPGRELMHVARELAKQAQEQEHWEEAVYYLTIVNSLIHDDEARAALDACMKKANH